MGEVECHQEIKRGKPRDLPDLIVTAASAVTASHSFIFLPPPLRGRLRENGSPWTANRGAPLAPEIKGANLPPWTAAPVIPAVPLSLRLRCRPAITTTGVSRDFQNVKLTSGVKMGRIHQRVYLLCLRWYALVRCGNGTVRPSYWTGIPAGVMGVMNSRGQWI